MGSDGSASELYFVKTQLQEWRCLWEAHSKRYLPEHAQQRLPSEAARSCAALPRLYTSIAMPRAFRTDRCVSPRARLCTR